MIYVANLVHLVIRVLILVIVVQALLSWVMDLDHPVRQFVDRLVNPFLEPIRRLMPPTSRGVDFSPLVLILILYLLDFLLTRLILLL